MIATLLGRSVRMLNSIPYLHRWSRASRLGTSQSLLLQDARPKAGPASDGVGLTWFAPVLPFSNHHVTPFLDEARRRFEAQGFDFY